MTKKPLLDLRLDENLTSLGRTLLTDYYLRPSETSPQEAFSRAAYAFCNGDFKLAQRIYGYASKQWFVPSSPIMSNAPAGVWENINGKYEFTLSEKLRAMPISCFLTHVPDNIFGQISASTELAAMSIVGGGVGQHLKMRGVTDKSSGVISYTKTSDSNILYYKQGKTRKGSVALYLDVEHPEIMEFIGVRIPTGGDINRKSQNIHNAVNITDVFREAVLEDGILELREPNTGKVVETHRAREVWEAMLDTRFRTGEPFINYLDEANRQLPQNLKAHGLHINGSNLCNEIHLPTDKERSAVCCLSSVNLEFYDEWKDTSMVRDIIRFLDNVLDFFIKHAPKGLEKAVRGATDTRDLGLGAMGFHSYLQRNHIPFESGGVKGAMTMNYRMFKRIKEEAVKETKQLAVERGEPPLMKGTGRRNAHLLAIAPNANSSLIAGTSPSIEPYTANYFVQRTRAGSHVVRNPYLEQILSAIGEMMEDVKDVTKWVAEQFKKINATRGSVQDLPYLSDELKAVFKTAREIDQRWLIDHARVRQEFICQGQSVNLFFTAGVSRREVNQVHLRAFASDGVGFPLKGLYYLRTNKSKNTEQLDSKVERKALKEHKPTEDDECLACHA
jgi:ribonucleoside-diphosphate reductase alpha chain